ncbi:hypothetical protein [Spirosoma aerolatum]|uniref:hypothetical protein n=1 Tax=Spirosoma aerolatum TaxID=1211326 RepID=UPI0009AE682F|nr:hypothetical protein [Spirosoma aerolatum]
MANLLVFNRAEQLLTFHPEWVDGCKNCPGPVDSLLNRVLGFMLRDIAHELKQPVLTKEIRQLGRSLVVKSVQKGEANVVVKSYDDDPCPTYPHHWEKLLQLLGEFAPVKPDPTPGPDWVINVKSGINDLLMAQSLQNVALLLPDKGLGNKVEGLAKLVSKEALSVLTR